jgi:hypothetical protein
MNTLPEAYALRRFYWQLFATLTFAKPPTTRAASLPVVFASLRDIARITRIYFPRLMWVLRFEVGPRGGNGHYHLCLAGIPRASLDRQLCRALGSTWRTRGGGFSEVALYDPARDGVGYILKLPPLSQGTRLWRESRSEPGGNDCDPMLSASLLEAIKRGRM